MPCFFTDSKIFDSSCNCVRRLLLGFSQEGITSLILLINGSTKDWIFGGCNNAEPPPSSPPSPGDGGRLWWGWSIADLLPTSTVREFKGMVNPDNRLANSLRDSMSVRLSTYFQVFACGELRASSVSSHFVHSLSKSSSKISPSSTTNPVATPDSMG